MGNVALGTALCAPDGSPRGGAWSAKSCRLPTSLQIIAWSPGTFPPNPSQGIA